MILNIYSIRDEQSTFGNPFAMANDGMAIRDFASAVNSASGSSALAFAPSDFVLYRVGQIDLETGVISPEPAVVFLMRGSDFFADKV